MNIILDGIPGDNKGAEERQRSTQSARYTGLAFNMDHCDPDIAAVSAWSVLPNERPFGGCQVPLILIRHLGCGHESHQKLELHTNMYVVHNVARRVFRY